MPATGNRPVRRLIDNRIRSALCILALGLTPVGLAGCRSPLGGQAALTADLSLSFIVSGAERLARDAAAQRIQGGVPGASSRLLLPTATDLSVTLTPESGGDAIATDPVSIVAGAATVPVSVSAVPYGRYTVKAEARDASGVARFTQAALLTVGDPELSVTLNLVPTDQSGAALAATTLHDIDIAELPAGEARTWLVAPGSRLLAARSVFLSGLGSDARVYLQAADGTFVSGAQGTGARLSTVNLPAEKPAYLTVYNGGGAVQPASRAFPGPAMVDVPAGAFQRDATATNVSHVSAFSMAALEVTRELYLAVMGTDPSDVGVSTGSAHPVHRISWYQALAFCNKLSLLENLKPVYGVLVSGSPIDWSSLDPGTIPTTSHTDWNAATLDAGADGYRLPRAMEWLWAAMGATSGSGYSGGVNTIGYSRSFAGSDGTNSEALFSWRDTGNIITSKAGSYSSNELGLYDMSGNVRELVWDWFESTVPPGSLHDYSGPSTNPNGSNIFRTWVGTCYNSGPWDLNMRSTYNAFDQHAQAGLRVARGSLPTYTVTYHANGATSGTAPASATVRSGQAYAVEGNTGNLARPGFMFAGWSATADGSGTPYTEGARCILGDSSIMLYARWASFVENGETLTVGSDNLNGQNGWVADTTGGFSAQVVNGHGVNATNVLGSSATYRLSSHALGGTIDMTDPKKAYRLSYDSVKPTWGTHFGIAADMDHDGVIAAGEEVWNFRVDNSGNPANLAYLVRPSGQISASIASVPGLDYDTWFQTELYFSQGLVTIRVKPWSTGVWTTVWADVSLETTANGDRTNPSTWSHLYFSMAAIDGYLDNIAFETITLP